MHFKHLFFLGFFFVLLSCATQVAPSGGPEDKLPPRVAAVSPAPQSINQSPELNVKLIFDEWISPTIPMSAISISPPIEKKLQMKVKGKELWLGSNSILDSNTTYTLTIANGLKDLRGNSIAKPFQLTFSTGSIIDSLSLTGRVMLSPEMLKNKTYPSIALFLMGKEERKSKRYLSEYPDSIPLLTQEAPLYITQSDSNGFFHFKGLASGQYRVLAFVDLNANRRVDLSTEWVGVYEKDISLNESYQDSVWIALQDQDTSFLELEKISQVGAELLQAEFSRPVFWEPFFFSKKNCFLMPNAKDTIFPTAVFKAPNSPHILYSFEKQLKKGSLYEFKCLYAKDSLDRVLDTLRNSYEIRWEDRLGDTLEARIAEFYPKNGAKNVFPYESIDIFYNKALSNDSVLNSFKLLIHKDTTPVSAIKTNVNALRIKPKENFPTDAKIELLQVRLDTLLKSSDSTGHRDTVISEKHSVLLRFETVSQLKQATLKGHLKNTKAPSMIRLRSIETGKTHKTRLLPSGHFTMGNLLEGKYIVDYYYSDKNGNPEVGGVAPFRYGLGWRSPIDTLVLVNGENDLNSIIKNLPQLP